MTERATTGSTQIQTQPGITQRRLSVVPAIPARADTSRSLLWRLVLIAAGVGLALLGWTLVMSVVLSFIGLPLFIVGMALAQAQER